MSLVHTFFHSSIQLLLQVVAIVVFPSELQRLMTKLLSIDNTSSPDGQVGAEVAANMSCQPPQWEGPQPNDVLFRTCVTEYFCGQGRSTSPFRK